MRIAINLATHPFVELRPLFARLRLVMAALAVTAIALGIGLHMLNRRARIAQAQMDDLKAQTLTVELERQTNEARMREPQNRAVLERSQFLNDLFARKSFSWTAVMMDLERVLPAGVQVTSIEPSITAEGNVNIRLRVSGQRDLAVDLVRNLEHSQRFLAPHLNNETAQSQERGLQTVADTGAPGGVEFDILSGYNPLPPSVKDREQEQNDKAAGQKDTSSQNKPAIPSAPKAPTNPKSVALHPLSTSAKPAANPKSAASPKPIANPKHAVTPHPKTTASSPTVNQKPAKGVVQ
jgi:type IV pilus assembly protein PilN